MSDSPMKKQALLIGINEYQILPGLKYARQDAEAVANSLKQNYCFLNNEVMLLTDARPGLFKPTNRYIIQEHLEKLANQELDLFIFGFWGHGLFRNGKRYLCPLDVMTARAEHQGLPFDELQELLANIHAKDTCLILDCCQTIHDRGEAETLMASDQTSMENAARDIVFRRKTQIPNFQSNVAILNSCKEGQSAYEWDARQHGLFTAHLLDAMNKRCTSVLQIASYISSNIEKTAMELGKEQTPFYKLEGDIVLPVATKSTPLVTGDVFISYRHCNADLVAPIEEELKKRGISYFIDRIGVNYSMDYSTVIARALKACKVLLVVWTKEANGSADMLQEIVVAKQLKKRVLPYKLGSFDVTEHDALFYQLSTLSRCEAAVQTQETIIDVVNQIELALTGKPFQQPTSKLPETTQNVYIQQLVIEDKNTTVPQTQNEQSQQPISKSLETTQDAVIQQPVIEDSNVTVPSMQIEQSQSIQYEKLPQTSRSSFEWDGTKIKKFIGKETDVVIPEDTTEIEDSAFSRCYFLATVVIPEGVTRIGDCTFYGCSSLTSVVIPESVKYIGYNAFFGCTALNEWSISSSHPYFKRDGVGLLTKDGKMLVACLASAKEYHIPEGVTKIEDSAFFNCSSLTSVVIPEGVTKIGSRAFSGCSSLTNVVIPEGTTEIGIAAFYDCKSLKSVIISEGIKVIGEGAFRDCSSLTSVVIPDSVTMIGSGICFGGAFSGCSSLTSVVIPKGVTEIGDFAFTWCFSLTSVVIPEGVTWIGKYAFRGCSSLTSVIIPKSVRWIGERAFEGCPVPWFTRAWWHKFW